MAADEVGKNTPDGTRLGQSTTSLVAFYGQTPIVQPSAAGQAAVSLAAVATSNGVSLVGSLANANLALLTAIRTALVNVGIMKGSA